MGWTWSHLPTIFRHVGLIQQIGLPKIFRHPTRMVFFNQPADCHPKDFFVVHHEDVLIAMRCFDGHGSGEYVWEGDFFRKIHLILKKQINRRSDWHPTKLPSLKLTGRPWKWMRGRRSGFLFGQFWPIFRGYMLVLGSVTIFVALPRTTSIYSEKQTNRRSDWNPTKLDSFFVFSQKTGLCSVMSKWEMDNHFPY